MSYQITFNGESDGVIDEDTVFAVLGTVIDWVETNPNQVDHGERVYQGIAHDGVNETMRISFRVENIDDGTPPRDVFAVIDDLIQNEINTPQETNFELAAESGSMR